jgi:hypothetical protein
MKRIGTLAIVASLVCGSQALAAFTWTGIVNDVMVTRTDIGGGLDQLILTVDLGAAEVDTWDGAFEPVSGTFNQNNSHSFGAPNPFPPKGAFDANAVAANDTTYLLTAIQNPDATVPSGQSDSGSLLAGTASFTDASLFTGVLDLAQLVVANGADAATAISTVAGSLATTATYYLINNGAVVGTISGDTTVSAPAIPEPTMFAIFAGLIGMIAIRRNR